MQNEEVDLNALGGV